jgi:uncharacterized protein YbjT (DUF2867 family)
MNNTALIAGATGLVGSKLLTLLLDSNKYQRVIAITRKPLEVSHHKLENIISNFEDLEATAEKLKADDVFCCLGTTMKQAGSKAAFKKVDYEYVIRLATLSKSNNAKQFLLISAMGANKNSWIYYNKIKGLTEDKLQELGFKSLYILRPSLIIGERNEKRTGEEVAQNIMPFLDNIMIGPLKKYASIDAQKIANKMLSLAISQLEGTHILLSDAIQK